MKIGFLDHHLNNYHANKFLGLFRKELAGEKIEVVAAFETHPEGEDWCAANGVKRAGSIQEVVDAADYIMAIAPDDVDAHLELARPAIEAKKPVFLDKSLSSELDDAREIVRLAEKHGTPIMTSSSLRFAVEVEELVSRTPGPYETVYTRGLGKWRGYATHTVFPALRLFGSNVKRLIDTGTATARLVTLDDGKRRCTIDVRFADNQDQVANWNFGVLKGDTYDVVTITKYHEFYWNLMKEAVEFFKTGKAPLSTQEMLMAVAVEVLAEESQKRGGEWVEVKL
jgi:hypothetical protein